MKHFILKIKLDRVVAIKEKEIEARDESEALDKFHDKYGCMWTVLSIKEK